MKINLGADMSSAGSKRVMCREVEFNHGKLIHGDCMEAIEDVEDESIDLVFTSPPYFQGKDFDVSRLVGGFWKNINQFQDKVYSKLKFGGSLCWQIGSHMQNGIMTPLDCLVHQICNEYPNLKLRNRVIWTFGHGEHAKKRLSGRYETVLWYTKGDNYTFNLDSIRVPQKYPGKKHYRGPNQGQLSGNPLGKNPGDVWHIPNVKANHVEKTTHPCQFPVALVARFVRALTSDSGLVLDPYSGSGSTAIATLETGRKFHCIEIDKHYFDISVDRVTKWYKDDKKIRPDLPVTQPDPQSSVATRPAHFLIGGIE